MKDTKILFEAAKNILKYTLKRKPVLIFVELLLLPHRNKSCTSFHAGAAVNYVSHLGAEIHNKVQI